MSFKDWLRGTYYRTQGKTPASQSMQDTLDHLAAQARYDGEEIETHVRVAHIGDKIYVDLANESWQAVEITHKGWRVLDNHPVKFRRPRGLATMPPPQLGGTLGALRTFINCRNEDWSLFVGWIIGAFSSGPYPILTLQGEQGAAKTFTSRIAKTLVDPNHSPQRTAPREVRDLMISATNSWCLSFDNLSGIPPWLSDGFCRLATGGGLSTRQLYSDDSETILEAIRPQILNGIDSMANRGDLADRAILLQLPRIKDSERQREADMWPAFKAAQPGILGAVFTAIIEALANIHKVSLSEYPRMADFASWVVASEPALPWEQGTFLSAYKQNRSLVVEHSLEADVVAVAVRSLMEKQETWEGSPSALLQTLEAITPEATVRSKVWPKAANILSTKLARAATFLRAIGIEIDTAYVQRARQIAIRKSG